jgi:hypothetical protein
MLFLSPFFEIEYLFSNHRQYLLDYPSNSYNDDSDRLVDDEAVDAHEPKDHVMDPDLVLEESDSQSSTDSNVQEDHGRYSHRC